jgi:regulation of enolase protein 1 (concanavalin A-like superfamily)
MSEPLLSEDFRRPALDPRLQWLIPPRCWRLDPSLPGLRIEPEAGTDFWQRTHYGFSADNGHFLGMELESGSDFVLSTQVRFHPVHQYDQAGLMIRADEACWVKASVEHEPGQTPRLGAVVTNAGYSDWSLQDYPFQENALGLRMNKRGADILVEFSPSSGERWSLMRVARLHLPPQRRIRAGLYACSPKGAGFRAEFTELNIRTCPPRSP